jgi:hypothetical protein
VCARMEGKCFPGQRNFAILVHKGMGIFLFFFDEY